MADHIESEDMVVDFVGVLVKATKGIDLVVSTIRDRGINKARGSLSQGSRQDLESVLAKIVEIGI